MSLFLGPIHHWIYQKIERRHRRVNEMVRTVRERHGEALLEGSGIPAAGLGELNDGQPLESLVRGFGIHDFLQQQIGAVECAEGSLLKAACANGDRDAVLEDLKAAVHAFGKREAEACLAASEEPLDLPALIDSLHLEAMPCSPVVEGATNDGTFVYRHVQCPHLANWQAIGVEPELMCAVERSWLAGIAETLGCRHEPVSSLLGGANVCEDRFSSQ